MFVNLKWVEVEAAARGIVVEFVVDQSGCFGKRIPMSKSETKGCSSSIFIF